MSEITQQGGVSGGRQRFRRVPRSALVPLVKWLSVAAGAVGLLLAFSALPLQDAFKAMQAWLTSFGPIAPLMYVAIYAVCVVLFVPGLPLTVAAGFIFAGFAPQPWGLLIATGVAIVGSNTGAAGAFLIGRYAARDKVAAMARQSGWLGAIDGAIQTGGWKIVAMLRLSPAVPFNLQNYLYGLTPIRFWPCVLTSIVAMLPGTFLYVYIGALPHLLQASAGAEQSAAAVWGKRALAALGLLATLAVTVYVTRLAKRALREQTELATEGDNNSDESGEANTPTGDRKESPDMTTASAQPGVASTPAWRGAVLAAVIGVGMLAGGVAAKTYQSSIRDGITQLFGPPTVTMTEAYSVKPDGPTFDHSQWDGIVSRHVDAEGFVDYAAIAQNPAPLNDYIASLEDAPYNRMGRDEKLALLINAYNAFTIKLILEHWNDGALDSIKDIPKAKRWQDERWQIASHTWSLNQIEHEQIRPKFKEPRIHFALVCAAYSCPPLRTEAYTADQLDQQLEDQTAYVHSHRRWFRFDPEKNTAHLTALYDWYGGDFKQTAGSVRGYVAQYAPQVKQAMERGDPPRIQWIDYSWKLNDKANRAMLSAR